MFHEDLDLDAEARRASDIQQRADRLRKDLDETQITVTSEDETISVDVDSYGNVLALRISSKHPLEQRNALEKALLSTIQTAQRAAKRYRNESSARYFG